MAATYAHKPWLRHGQIKKANGRPRYIANGDALIERYNEYVDWCDNNPLKEQKVFGSAKDGVVKTTVDKRRVRTVKGFCKYLGITNRCWELWCKNREDLQDAIADIRDDISNDKYEGGVAGLYHAGIIYRDLGLIEKRETDNAHKHQLPPPDKAPALDEAHAAIHVHPNDPNPLDLPRPLFSRAQLDAGIPFMDYRSAE